MVQTVPSNTETRQRVWALEVMRLTIFGASAMSLLWLCLAGTALAHDDIAGRESEFRHGYQIGYITAIRDANEGIAMCTKDVPLLEIIKAISTYNKALGTAPELALSAKNISSALTAQYKCPHK
jgi:hypothetical protein